MALTPAEQQRLNNLIQEGIQLARQLNDTQQQSSFQNFTGSLTDAERLVSSLRDEWREYTQDVAGTALNFTRIVDEIKDMNSGVKRSQQAFSSLSSLAQTLQSHQEGINKLSSKEIKNLKDKVKNKISELNLSKQLLEDQLSQQNLSTEEQIKSQTALNNINQSLNDNTSALNQFNTQLSVATQNAENLEDSIGLGGNALDGMVSAMDSLGMKGLSEKLGLDEAKKKMEEMADELTNGGETAATMGDKFKIMGAGLKSMGSSLGKNLTDPAFLIQQMADALKIADDGAGDLAKGMNMTYGEALNTRRELGNMATMSGDVALNTKNLQENMMAVSKAIGSNTMLNEKDLKTMTKLTSQAGFTADELMGVQKLSLVNGKSLEDNTKEILGGAKAYASRNKMVVNEKDVLREVNKASASLKLSLGGSAEAVAVAVVKAKQFGLTLEQAEKISSNLLQFETSIENELSAELLTGKELNFERARSLALEGKTAEAAAEVAKQVGTSKDFAKMNVIQQEALAKAAGMERDELAQSLMDKEAMAKMNDVEGATAKEKFDNLVKQVGMEEAKAQLGDEALANQFQQQSVQERFAQATEKLKEVFIQIAEPVLAIVSPLMNLVGSVLPLINILLQPLIVGFQVVADTINYIVNSVTGLFGMLTGSNKELSVMQGIIGAIAASYLLYQGLVVATNIYQGISAAFSERKALAENASKMALIAQKVSIVAAIPFQVAYALITGTKAIAEVTAAEALSLGLATIAIVGGLAMVIGAMSSSKSKINDGVFPAAGGSGYGKRVLSGPEGSIQLNNKDTVIAGTDLFSKGDDVMSPSLNELSKPQEIKSPTNNITNNYTQNQNQEKEKLTVANSTSLKKEATPDPNASTNSRLDSLIKATTKVNSVSTLRIQ
jgi:hypothetical protein